MKGWRIATILLLSLVLVGSMSCTPFGQKEPEASQRLVEVVRGNLTVTVSGSGNLEISKEKKLTFSAAGRVEKIYVKEGDQVSEAEVLAKLETGALELSLAQAQVAQRQSPLALVQAEIAKDQVQVTRDQAKIARDQAVYPAHPDWRGRGPIHRYPDS